MFYIKGILLIYASALSYGHLVHGRATQFLDHEDWGEYVESPHEITDYDVVVPTVIHNERHRRSEVNNLPSQLTFTAFGEDYQLSMSPSQKFFSPDLEIEYVHGDGTIEKTKMTFDEDCFYDGHVVSHNSSGAVVSICDENIRGIISSSDVAVFITPLTALHAQEYARRYKRSSNKFHLVYKRSVDGVPGFCGVKETPEQELNENKAAQFNAASPENSFIAPKYLEINLILDVDFVDKYSPDHVVIATTIMNAVSRRYSDPSLGISLRLYIVRMIVLNTDTPTIEGTSFFIDPVLGQNGDTLDSVRAWSLAVNPQGDDNPGHWDNVVIISGKALIFQGDTTDNTLLGIAFNGGTCIGELGVSISTDLGLASAFVIAHEIGHTLTLPHDEDIGCAEGFIMSGFLLPGPNASLWSSCSRTNLQEYLRWQLPDYQTECMDDIPLGVDVLQTLQLPGRTYSWDQQCDMLIPGSTSCGEIECSNIACSEPSGDCLPQGFPVAEGTPCGAGLINEICLAGVCSLESAIPIPVNGGWSVWSETQCSRTCGGGVIIRQRVCNNPAPVFGGDPCDGEGVEFRLCNLNSCQTTSDDFRDEQCAATQSEPTAQGTVTQWTQFFAPFIINEEQYCLNPCLSTQLMFALRPPRMNTDGTECWNYRQTDESILLRCVSGTCQRFGCDGLQRGNLQVFDVCRVCGGDGSTCTRQADNGTASTVSVFNQIVEIPVGSTSILIINNNVAGGNHIAISSPVSGDKFRGSGFTPDVTTRAFVGPYVIVHESTSTTESFRIPGPIPEPLVVELFLSTVQASQIQYEYYSSNFFWNIGVFGPCSATCNGVQMRTVTCTSGVEGAQSILADNICENNIGPKPETTRSCNEFVCPRWVVGDFGECAGVCGSGTQTRIVTCQQENTIVSNTMCDPLLEPQSQQTCNLGNCVWVPGPFGPCSVTCGLGTQSTIFVCMNNLFPVAENDCLDPVPTNNRTCFAGSCDVPRWVIASAFSECSTKCGKGTQRRLVECRIGFQVIDDNNCDSRSMPNKSQVCISIRCLLDDDCEPVENPFVRRGPNSNTVYNAP